MQKQGDEVEQEVTWEDQQRIVSFSQKNGRIHELTDEINALETKIKNWQDAVDEFMMPEHDEEATFRCLFGESYIHMSKDQAEQFTNSKKDAFDADLARLRRERDAVAQEMAELKRVLYAKFKGSINLEEDQ